MKILKSIFWLSLRDEYLVGRMWIIKQIKSENDRLLLKESTAKYLTNDTFCEGKLVKSMKLFTIMGIN
jgi:hypothetical protein